VHNSTLLPRVGSSSSNVLEGRSPAPERAELVAYVERDAGPWLVLLAPVSLALVVALVAYLSKVSF
jgi:hypothetical protein